MGAVKNAMMEAGDRLRADYRSLERTSARYPFPVGVAADLYDARMTLAHAIANTCILGEPSVCREWFQHCAEDACHGENLDRCACGHYRFQHSWGGTICTAPAPQPDGVRLDPSVRCGILDCRTGTDWDRWAPA